MRTARRATTALAIGAAAALIGTTPAIAATATWHVAKTFGAHQFLTSVVTVNSKDAWTFGGTGFQSQTAVRPVANHWNGKSWHDSPLPKGVSGSWIFGAGASSASDVWAVGGQGEIGQGPAFALHWNGSKWAIAKRWNTSSWATGIAVVGPGDVWVLGSAFGLGTWHFNGHSWTSVKTGSLPAKASVVSGKNIWAVGFGPLGIGNPMYISRYNGKAWATVSGNGLPSDTGQPNTGKPYQLIGWDDVAAISANDVWASGSLNKSSDGTQIAHTGLLVHWNGKSWTSLTVPQSSNVAHITSDGNGGLWVSSPAQYGVAIQHLSKSGHWATATVLGTGGKTVSFNDLARVPGATSVFGVGSLGGSGINGTSVVFRYGT
jgi:hypothetical protein